jgi:Cu-processing system permease protein
MGKLVKFIAADILKNRIVLVYTLILAVFSWSVFSLEDNSTKGILTLLNVILLTVPLVSVIFSTIYLYNSAEFIELLLSQPVARTKIWLSLFIGLAFSLSLAFFFGVGIPALIYAPGEIGWMMVLVGIFISVVFVSIAFLCAILTRDKAKGIGLSIMTWLFL